MKFYLWAHTFIWASGIISGVWYVCQLRERRRFALVNLSVSAALFAWSLALLW